MKWLANPYQGGRHFFLLFLEFIWTSIYNQSEDSCAHQMVMEVLQLCWLFWASSPTSFEHTLYYYPFFKSHIQSRLYKCYSYKRYNFIYVKKIILPHKNTIGMTSECYVLSVITCSTPFFVNCTSISVNFEKIKVIIYESIHLKHVITFIPYSLQTSQIFSFIRDPSSLCTFTSNLREEMADKEGLGVGVFAGVDDYRYFLAVYTRFWEEDGVGTE